MSSKNSSIELPKEIVVSFRTRDDDAESVSSGVSGFSCDYLQPQDSFCRFNCFGVQAPIQSRNDLLGEVDRDMHDLLLLSQTINSDEEFSFSDSSSLGFSCFTDDEKLLREEEEKYGSVEHDDLPTQR